MKPSPLPPHVELLSPAQDSEFPDEWYGLNSPEHFWFEWRLEATLGQLRHLHVPLGAPLHGLDVGGGTGLLRDQLEARTAWTIDLAELNAAALRLTRPGRGRTLCYDVAGEVLPLAGTYDVVLLFDVLEHIEKTRPFLRGVLEHLKPGGLLLINVPAGPRLFSAYDTAAGHVRRYDRPSLAAEFDGTGLRIDDIRYWGFMLVFLVLARKWMVRGNASRDRTIRGGFEPPGRFVHAMLRSWFRAETAILRPPPLGSSLLLAGRNAAPVSAE